jgi:hypothetical protein
MWQIVAVKIRGNQSWNIVQQEKFKQQFLQARFALPSRCVWHCVFHSLDPPRESNVYEVFKRMLMRGKVPTSIYALLDESRKP